MDQFNITPQQFIVEGKPFKSTAQFDDRDVTIVSKVVKEDDIYKLVIKGDYTRSSECTITLSQPDIDVSLDDMQEFAIRSMQVVIPKFIMEDYPDSLKKVAEDEAADEAKAVNPQDEAKAVNPQDEAKAENSE